LEARFKNSKLGKIFRSFDKSGDGKITLAEFGQLFEGGLSAGHRAQFNAFDRDKNMGLDRIEFLEMRLAPPGRER